MVHVADMEASVFTDFCSVHDSRYGVVLWSNKFYDIFLICTKKYIFV